MDRSPERTCIGCRVKAGQGELVRLVLVEGRVVVDRARRGGRGAWIHPTEACLSQAMRRKALGRAFRDRAVADEAVLRVQLTGSARKD
jgi:predicted RNA-binding protein YlxR (DUF448 family)